MSNDAPIETRKFKNKRIRSQHPLSDFIGKKNHVSHPLEERPIENEKKKTVKPIARISKKDSTIKKFINVFEKNENINICSEPEEYDEKVLNLLRALKRNFDVKYKKNENKARAHRVMVAGIHETVKHLKNDSIKVIFISRNVDESVKNWFGKSNFFEMYHTAIQKGVPVIHSNTKKQMSTAIKKFPYINVIGLMAFPGYESLFSEINQAWKNSRSHVLYHKDQSSLLA
ncbi:unnamed protein product [Auanema sp. JU1783]|nr:unnamed protein product [Auanema sp. JU1783]